MVFLESTDAVFIVQSMSMTSWQSANAAMHGSHAKFLHWDGDFLTHNASRVNLKPAWGCCSKFYGTVTLTQNIPRTKHHVTKTMQWDSRSPRFADQHRKRHATQLLSALSLRLCSVALLRTQADWLGSMHDDRSSRLQSTLAQKQWRSLLRKPGNAVAFSIELQIPSKPECYWSWWVVAPFLWSIKKSRNSAAFRTTGKWYEPPGCVGWFIDCDRGGQRARGSVRRCKVSVQIAEKWNTHCRLLFEPRKIFVRFSDIRLFANIRTIRFSPSDNYCVVSKRDTEMVRNRERGRRSGWGAGKVLKVEIPSQIWTCDDSTQPKWKSLIGW